MVLFCKIWKKYNEIQLTKNKMDLNNRKMTDHPPSPVITSSATTLASGVLSYQYLIFTLTVLYKALLHKTVTNYTGNVTFALM